MGIFVSNRAYFVQFLTFTFVLQFLLSVVNSEGWFHFIKIISQIGLANIDFQLTMNQKITKK